MKIDQRLKVISFFLVGAYLLAACGGALSANALTNKGPNVQDNIVAFTGIVEAISENQWTVGGKTVTLDPQASLDPNIAVGDEVKVEAKVNAGGTVVALKVESPKPDDTVASPSTNLSTVADLLATQSSAGNTNPGVSNSLDASSTQAAGMDTSEIFGTVGAITADTITVNGVTYNLTNLTQNKDALKVGDQVKVHLTMNADGTLAVREIEKSTASVSDNSSSSSSNDGPTHDLNDDHSNGSSADDGPNHDINDDHGGSGGNSGSSGDD